MRVMFSSQSLFDAFPKARGGNAFKRAQLIRERLKEAGVQGYGGFRYADPFFHMNTEVQEFQNAVIKKEPLSNQQSELGDVLYIASTIGYLNGLDPQKALQHANDKFVTRYKTMESISRERYGTTDLARFSEEERQTLWLQAKQELKKRNSDFAH